MYSVFSYYILHSQQDGVVGVTAFGTGANSNWTRQFLEKYRDINNISPILTIYYLSFFIG